MVRGIQRDHTCSSMLVVRQPCMTIIVGNNRIADKVTNYAGCAYDGWGECKQVRL